MLTQKTLFDPSSNLDAYIPRPVDNFTPNQIILASGSQHKKNLINSICRLYPKAKILEKINVSHAKIQIDGQTLIDCHYAGKKTLVFGELKSAVRFSEESDNTCPNYWHFSSYGFCPYGCHYCYLAGTVGVKFSPTVKIFLNLQDILQKINQIATRLNEPTAFYLGKLQDALALDPLTGYSRIMIPFFANHPHARLVLLTKSADVKNLLGLNHVGKTILSWSLNPPEIVSQFEENTPPIESRLDAMEKCHAAGYPIRAVIMPIIPVPNWQQAYENFLTQLLKRIPLTRLTLGGICSYTTARSLMNGKMTPQNAINQNMKEKSPDGRYRYPADLRIEIYSHLLKIIHRLQPHLQTALCLEQKNIWQACNLQQNPCNCLL
ncbi:MAG: radical SAM protein [Phycisphaerae bacterium]